jgi:hypothetical protein
MREGALVLNNLLLSVAMLATLVMGRCYRRSAAISPAHSAGFFAAAAAVPDRRFSVTIQPDRRHSLRRGLRMIFIRPGLLQSRADASEQNIPIKRLAQAANDAIGQGASSNALLRVGRDQDRWNCIPRLYEMAVQFDPGHLRHMDVCDQAGGIADVRGCQEIPSGWERRDREPHRVHQTC